MPTNGHDAQVDNVVKALSEQIDERIKLTEQLVRTEQERLAELHSLHKEITELREDFNAGQADVFARISQALGKLDNLERIARDNQNWLSDMSQTILNIAESGRRTRKAVDETRKTVRGQEA